METMVLSPTLQIHNGIRKSFEENLAEAEKIVARKCAGGDGNFSLPPRQILQYIVRMGSFTSVPAIREDSQDIDFEVPHYATRETLMERCLSELPLGGQPISRHFEYVNPKPGKRRNLQILPSPSLNMENEDGNFSPALRRLSFISEACGSFSETEEEAENDSHFRILTWNVLAQALAVSHDNFVGLPEGTLNWNLRRLHILHEILAYNPDVICLQEVDHFNFLRSSLKPLGFRGVFCSKPDSPCIYLANNNGPDGCALFFREDKFDLISASSRIIEIWKIQSNQVCILANLRLRETGQQVSIATTHLKARHGPILATMRNEQGKDLANFLNSCGITSNPMILCGDFNAVPKEPVVATIKKRLAVKSAYAELYNGEEPPFTTWKVREDGEHCDTLDYIFHNKYLTVESVLALPTSEEVGPTRLPNLNYPSDHVSICCDFRIVD